MRHFLTFLLILLPILPVFAEDSFYGEKASVYRDEGYRLQSMGDLEKALTYYQKSAVLNPNNVEIHNDLGVVYEQMDKPTEALAMYEKALELDTNYLPTYTNLAFLYENKGDIKNAAKYWQIRYELGQKGEYWWEVSRQHLLKLGTYPALKQERLMKEAIDLSRKLKHQREQKRLKDIEEAMLRFDVGVKMLKNGDYPAAILEFKQSLAINHADQELKNKTVEFLKKADKAYKKDQVISYIEEALNCMKKDDFLSAGEKLKSALSSVFSISQTK